MKYSIITINYNNRDGLRRTIESVVNQTCQDFEYIVIDGGSTDGSVEVIKEYADRIDYWVSEPDKGIYNAMNKGILQAHGEYLNFMNSGDCFYDENVLENSLLYFYSDICCGKVQRTDNIQQWYNETDEISMMLFYNASIPHQASFICKKLFYNSLYNENYRIISDWEFFLKKIILENCSYNCIPITIALFDVCGISSTNKKLYHQERMEVLQSVFPMRILEDYKKFCDKESLVLYLIPEFNRTNRLEKLIYWTIKCILKIYHIFK